MPSLGHSEWSQYIDDGEQFHRSSLQLQKSTADCQYLRYDTGTDEICQTSQPSANLVLITKKTTSRRPSMSVVWSRLKKSTKIWKILVSYFRKSRKSWWTLANTKTNSERITALQDLQSLDPSKNEESKAKFLEFFDWKNSTLALDEIARTYQSSSTTSLRDTDST